MLSAVQYAFGEVRYRVLAFRENACIMKICLAKFLADVLAHALNGYSSPCLA